MVSLQFERGDSTRPVGHAFLYFTEPGDQVGATYILVPPIVLDFAKYVPPFLASSLGSSGFIAQTSFIPVPPVPERIALAELRRLAELRGDDVLVAGAITAYDVPGQMGQIAELGEAYSHAYQVGLDHAAATRADVEEKEPEAPSFDTQALLYSVLPERERLDNLAQQLVKLRYAVETGDLALAQATRSEIGAIVAYLPKKYRAEELVEVAARNDAGAGRLAQLYFERGYKLASDDFEGLLTIEAEIEALRGSTQGA